MGNYKCVGLLYIRENIRQAGPEVEKKFLASLSPEQQQTFRQFITTTWIPIETATTYYIKSAPLLFPANPAPSAMQMLGRASMDHNLKGVYRLAMRFASVNMIISKLARTWRTYHDVGDAACEIGEGKQLVFTLTYASLPAGFPEILTGCIESLMDSVGAKENFVKYHPATPATHTWQVSWV
jgi:hypothetical protein